MEDQTKYFFKNGFIRWNICVCILKPYSVWISSANIVLLWNGWVWSITRIYRLPENSIIKFKSDLRWLIDLISIMNVFLLFLKRTSVKEKLIGLEELKWSSNLLARWRLQTQQHNQNNVKGTKGWLQLEHQR